MNLNAERGTTQEFACVRRHIRSVSTHEQLRSLLIAQTDPADGRLWGPQVSKFANRTTRGANFLFLGIVQIAGHQDVRCERLESKEFVFLLSFFPVFQRPVVGARMLCAGFARSTNRRNSAVSPGRTWFVDLRRFSYRPGSLGLLALSSKSGRWARDPRTCEFYVIQIAVCNTIGACDSQFKLGWMTDRGRGSLFWCENWAGLPRGLYARGCVFWKRAA